MEEDLTDDLKHSLEVIMRNVNRQLIDLTRKNIIKKFKDVGSSIGIIYNNLL